MLTAMNRSPSTPLVGLSGGNGMHDVGVLSVTGVCKRYGPVQALDEAHLCLAAGEIRGLVGSNGAGKSTLLKVLTGAVRPDAGEVRIAGEPIRLGSPQRALAAGLSCIYQHGNLAPAMTVCDNIVAGVSSTNRSGTLSRSRQYEKARDLLDRFDIDLDLAMPVERLGTVDRKFVEIAKALYREPDTLLMDEPTAWLSRADAGRLHETTRTLAAEGVAVIYVSHFLDDVLELVNYVTVLRDGQVVLDEPNWNLARGDLVEAMLGTVDSEAAASVTTPRKAPSEGGEPLLSCRSLSRYNEFSDVSLELVAGEILCITGLIGSGRTEVLETLYGVRAPDSGSVAVAGVEKALVDPASAIRQSIALVPEDRHASGLMLSMTVRQNLIMTSLHNLGAGGVLAVGKVNQQVSDLIDSIGIVPPNPNQAVGTLSGGNQQKVLIARCVGSGARVLLLDEPTVGVDIAAKVEIYEVLRRLASEGRGVIFVSTDLDEVEELADRVMVMRGGVMVEELGTGEITHRALLDAISGETGQ